MKRIIVIIASLLLQSCAVSNYGKQNTTEIEGKPSNAKVYYNGLLAGQTPCKIYIPSKDLRPHKLNANLTISANGYESKEIKLKPKIRTNVLVFDAIALISMSPFMIAPLIDYSSGVMFKPEKKIDYKLNQNK